MKRYFTEWPALTVDGSPVGLMVWTWAQTDSSAAAMMSASCCWRMSAILCASAADWKLIWLSSVRVALICAARSA